MTRGREVAGELNTSNFKDGSTKVLTFAQFLTPRAMAQLWQLFAKSTMRREKTKQTNMKENLFECVIKCAQVLCFRLIYCSVLQIIEDLERHFFMSI